MSADKETFLVVQYSEQSDYVNAFLFQGTYEELYALDHTTWSLRFFLLAADTTQVPGAWGTPLLDAGTQRSIYQADMFLCRALHHLRHVDRAQRAREVKALLKRIEREQYELTVITESPEQKLERLNIRPLTEGEAEQLKRGTKE